MVSPVSSVVTPPPPLSQLLHSHQPTCKACLLRILAQTKNELDMDLPPGEGASCGSEGLKGRVLFPPVPYSFHRRCWLPSTLEVSRCLGYPLEEALALSRAG